MLSAKKRITMSGESVIGDKVVCVFSATIDPDHPKDAIVSQMPRDKEMYRQHCTECRADFAEFEDLVWKTADALKE